MLKAFRYALATICFAASVGCLAMWCWSVTQRHRIVGASWYSDERTWHASVDCGHTVVSVAPRAFDPRLHSRLQFRSATVSDVVRTFALVNQRPGLFGMRH